MKLFFDHLNTWAKDAAVLQERYQSAQPYPHIALDNFLPSEIAERLEQNFPLKEAPLWQALPTDDQKHKYAADDFALFPDPFQEVISALNSGPFVTFLERVTGISNLIVDAKLSGGGLHRIERGGKLNVHVDYSHHGENGLSRRINLLIYLNKDWQEEYGGHFEFWNMAGKEKTRLARIAPLFNRCVIFSTSPQSFHGHPEPLNCPPDMARKSLALYYFTNSREDGQDQEHNTLFHTTTKHEKISVLTKLVRLASSDTVRDLLPPMVYRQLKNFWNKK
jgi:hypothetical protein